jgi:hypothetical protein
MQQSNAVEAVAARTDTRAALTEALSLGLTNHLAKAKHTWSCTLAPARVSGPLKLDQLSGCPTESLPVIVGNATLVVSEHVYV